MSSKKERKVVDPLELQAHFDGELGAEDAARIEAALAVEVDERARFEALGEMGKLLRFEAEQRLEQEDFAGLWSGLQERLAQERELARAVASRHEAPAKASFGQAIVRFFALHRVVLLPALALAVIAVVVLLPLLAEKRDAEHVVEKERTIVIVEPLRFEGQATGTVSYAPGSNTPVIWYLGDAGGPAEPAVLSPAALRIPLPIERIVERLERLERLAWPNANADEAPAEVRRYNLDALRETDWYQRHRTDGPI